MMRQLLTLIALITGLAATAMPMEARAQAPNRAQMQLAVECAALAATAHRAQHAMPLAVSQPTPIVTEPLALAQNSLIRQALRIGIDRAHE